MSRSTCRVRLAAMSLFSLVLFTSVAVADEREASSIVEFVAAKDDWDRRVGQPMRLEGRYTFFSSSEVRFKNCSMRFVHPESFRRPGGSPENLEVSGQLVRKDGGLVFRVSDLKSRESDGEMLIRKRSLINNSRPDGVYELAAWARQRGEFYDDDELRTAAENLYAEGLTIGYQHLKSGDVAGLRDLAKKADEFALDEGVRLRYLHEADRLEWKVAEGSPQPDFRRVLGLIRRDLPGAMTPLPRRLLAIREHYEKDPIDDYRFASAEMRRLRDRAFYLEVGLANILHDAVDDGRNGYETARRIERELPELTALADTYRQQELQYLSARLARLTRTQMIALSARYKQRDDAQQATQVVREWLKSREPGARQDGPSELMELGDEYVNLLNDERTAARLYKLAYQQNPQLESAANWLRTRGYQLRAAQWSKPGESVEDADEVMINEAIQEGRVQVGMTAEQVRQTLGTKPSSIIRMASAGQIAELWVFKDDGITVRLRRRSTMKTSQVVEIGTID